MLEAKNLNKEISVKKIDDETLNVKIFTLFAVWIIGVNNSSLGIDILTGRYVG